MEWIYVLSENLDGTMRSQGYYDVVGTVSVEEEAKKFVEGEGDRKYDKLPMFKSVKELMEWMYPSCPNCGCPDTSKKMQDHTSPYGYPESVDLTVKIPMHSCNARGCNFQWYNWEAEEIMDAYTEQWKYEQGKKENET